jgi:prophage regulatory protein
MATTVRPLRVISWRELSEMIPFTRQHVLRLEKAGKFPRRIQIGARRVGWLYTEIEAWVAQCAALRRTQASAD